MSQMLEVIQAELAGARGRVGVLEHMEKLALALERGGGEDAGAEAPVKREPVGVLPPASPPGDAAGPLADQTETSRTFPGRNGTQRTPALPAAGVGGPSADGERAPHPRSRPAGQHSRSRILDLLTERGALSSREIQDAVGLSQTVVDRHLRALQADEAIVVTGGTNNRHSPRRFEVPRRALSPAPEASPADETAQRPQAAVADEPLRRRLVTAALEQYGPHTFGDLQARTRLARGQLLTTLQELARNNQVVQDDDRRWMTTAQRDQQVAERNGKGARLHALRGRILDAIATDPGALTEQRLAQVLDADREDIAVICGEHLEAGDLVLNPDGTYTPAREQGGGPGTVDKAPGAYARLQEAREAVTA